MNWLGSLICTLRRNHRWTRRKSEAVKRCVRCGVTKAVRSRVKKVAV